ncbi:DUF262 domain-containing protein [Frigoribacterium sp. CFBP 8766]|nr:DUF262 domain-containing protein [Frigoribacterium sp. CFBP 8766]
MIDALSTATALRERFVGDIDESFWVPAYQRGYRWSPQDVEKLLDDIWESEGSPYYLQPVVVKAMVDGRWELIDGQQRLTTVYLVLQYMHHESLQGSAPAFSLQYETRPEMARLIKEPALIGVDANIDAFHLSNAYRAIEEWFDAHKGRRQFAANKIYGYFFESVRFIWYEAPAKVDSATVFTRLNVGRIPLTDAELVKALLLAKAGNNESTQGRDYEIAAQWDAMERELRSAELWAFATGGSRDDSSHISLLLDVISSETETGNVTPFQTFEELRSAIETDWRALWNRVLDLHSTVVGWFEDGDLFHRIGFLIATGDRLTDIVSFSKGLKKSDLDTALIERIRERLGLSAEAVPDLSYERRSVQRTETALLLMNVESVRRRGSQSERYSFHEHAAGKWSLEHIHAQNAERLNREDQWRDWLQLHRSVLDGVAIIDLQERESIKVRIDDALARPKVTESNFRAIETDVLRTLGGEADVDMHAITNLALLDAGANSALGNAVFEVKRREVLRLDKVGRFIPPCTRNVFLKYYTPDASQQLHFWGPADREGYLVAIIEMLTPYLSSAATDVDETGDDSDD